MSIPKLSIIIPTFNRENLLKHTLNSIKNQNIETSLYEIIVIDDGGNDNTEKLCHLYKNSFKIKYHWQEDLGFRVSKARNVGTTIADGKYIIYIDSGVILDENALKKHLICHEESKRPLVILGYVYGFGRDEEIRNKKILNENSFNDLRSFFHLLSTHDISDIREDQYNEFGTQLSFWPAPFDLFYTCHLSVEKSEVLNVGLFDEHFTDWGGEDVDLGIRLFLNNNLFKVDKSICSFHYPHERISMGEALKTAHSRLNYIHEKYNLWQTEYYLKFFSEDKPKLNRFFLNQIIKDYYKPPY